MKIEHVAIWTQSLEVLRDFYVARFGARPGARYDNPAKGFSSYFLSFEGGARVELMSRTGLPARRGDPLAPAAGFAHLAFSLGSVEAVDAHCAESRAGGLPILDGPRWTGDGYYEYVTRDPDGNRLEVTI
jgi:lactoylglutathione lyase